MHLEAATLLPRRNECALKGAGSSPLVSGREQSVSEVRVAAGREGVLLNEKKERTQEGYGLQIISPFLKTEAFPKGLLKPKDSARAENPRDLSACAGANQRERLPSPRTHVRCVGGRLRKGRDVTVCKRVRLLNILFHGDRGACLCSFWQLRESDPQYFGSKSPVPGQPYKVYRRSRQEHL